MQILLRGICLPVLLFVVCRAAHAQSLFFQPPVVGGSGENVTADFDRDGKVDRVDPCSSATETARSPLSP
jgi:hypothetical protein